MTDFIEMVIHKDTSGTYMIPSGDSEQILTPILDAMTQEGYY